MIEYFKKLFNIKPRSVYKHVATCKAVWVREDSRGKYDDKIYYTLLEDQYGNRKCLMSKFSDGEYHPVYEGPITAWLHGADVSIIEHARVDKKVKINE